MNELPSGFEPLFRTSPYIDLLGPIYNKNVSGEIILGLRVAEKHCNARGLVHGGLLSSVADITLGYNAAYHKDEPLALVTASLSIDFVSAAKIGEWIETRTTVQKVGRSMAFANCYFLVGEKHIARASCVFNVPNA